MQFLRLDPLKGPLRLDRNEKIMYENCTLVHLSTSSLRKPLKHCALKLLYNKEALQELDQGTLIHQTLIQKIEYFHYTMRNTDDTSNGFDNGRNMLQHHQLREIVVKKIAGEEGSLNYLSIAKEKPKLPNEKRSYEEPLSPVACLTTGRILHSYIFTIVGFKKYIDVVSFKISLQNTLAQHQRFSSILIRGRHNRLKWSLRELEINDHVIVPFLDPSFTRNPDFVNEYTASLATAPPLNPSRPLWEVHVLNASSVDAAASLVFRVHHSLGDCVSMLSLIVNSTRKASDPKFLPTIPENNKLSREKEISSTLRIVYSWLAAFWLTFLILFDYIATVFWKKDVNPLKADTAKTAICCSNSKRLAHVTLDMVDIFSVKKAVNGTVNDVMMGVISAGFVRYFSRHNSTPKTARNTDGTADHKYCLPSNLRARALVAVNTRPSHVLKNLDSNMKNPTQVLWGNKLGFWLFPLPMVQYEDPLEYCRATTNTSRIKKFSFEGSLSFFLATSLATKLVEYIANKLSTSTTLGFSNVIGPAEEIEFCDNHVTHIIPTAYVNHATIVMHFISYGGKGKLVALVSEDVVPDPQQLCSDCADALQRMKEAAHK